MELNVKSKIPSILQKIVETKREEVTFLHNKKRELNRQIKDLNKPLDFGKAIIGKKKTQGTIISEVKKASPSAGILENDFNPEEIADKYQQGGADAISVLTDIKYFKGSSRYLTDVKKAVSIPVLRKDFIICEEQIYESRIIGADSFLLISAILDEYQLTDFLSLGRELGMEPLIEVHSQDELDKTLRTDAYIIGINNRDLNTFTVDINTSLKLMKRIPENKIIVSESGIISVEIAHKLYKSGCNSLLIGEFLMRSGDKPQLIRDIKSC